MDALAFVHHFWQVLSLVHVGQLKNYHYRYGLKPLTRGSNFITCCHGNNWLWRDSNPSFHAYGLMRWSLDQVSTIFEVVVQSCSPKSDFNNGWGEIQLMAMVWFNWFNLLTQKNSTIGFFFHKWRRFAQTRASTFSSFFFQVSPGLIEGLLTLIWA